MRASLLPLLLLVGCGGAETVAPTTPASSARAVWTGDVSEEAFARLHGYRDEEAPPLQGEAVTLGDAAGYLSLPEGEPSAAVLVIHEWWGLNDHIRHWTDRLAADGYAALAVDLYGGEAATTPEGATALMRAVDDGEAEATLRAAAAFLETDPRTAPTERRAVIGWCFGGGWSLEAAIRIEGFDAAVMYYGRPVTEVERLREIDGPLLGIFGNQDDSIPPARVDGFEAALDEAGVAHTVRRFDAPHAFANPSSDRYVPDAAAEAWEATRAFLRAHLLEAQPPSDGSSSPSAPSSSPSPPDDASSP